MGSRSNGTVGGRMYAGGSRDFYNPNVPRPVPQVGKRQMALAGALQQAPQVPYQAPQPQVGMQAQQQTQPTPQTFGLPSGTRMYAGGTPYFNEGTGQRYNQQTGVWENPVSGKVRR